MSESFDFIVIGGGSAGYAAARTAVDAGLKTAVIDGAEELGGLCILRGCMPSKTYIESANRFLTLREADEFGLKAEGIGFDATRILARKKRLIGEFADYRREQLESRRFTLFRGKASFLDATSVSISDGRDAGRVVEGKQFLLATGSVITIPEFEGLESADYLTSDDVLESDDVPESILVLGAGPIALEFAHYYSAMGARVHILLRGPELLRGVDPELSGALRGAFEKRGVQVHRRAQNWRFSRTSDGQHCCQIEIDGQTFEIVTEKILAALGRRPATQGLELETAGVDLDRGRVISHPTQQTSAKHIYAAGDVTGPHEIVHIAIEQGEIAARNAARDLGKLEGKPEEISYRNVMFGVFTWPQLAMTGISDDTAREQGYDPISASYPFNDHGKSLVRNEVDGLVKLTADRKSGELLSGGVVGPEGTELIHEIGVAIHYGATVHSFMKAPHYHPTLSEIWTYPAEELAEQCGGGSP